MSEPLIKGPFTYNPFVASTFRKSTWDSLTKDLTYGSLDHKKMIMGIALYRYGSNAPLGTNFDLFYSLIKELSFDEALRAVNKLNE